MQSSTKQNLKIKLKNHAEFLKAQDAFIKLGYCWGGNGSEPCTAPYLYSDSDGHILADFFDVEGADLSSPNSAFGYFANHKNREVSLDELTVLATHHVVWNNAPPEAFHWERLPNRKCIWHCHSDGRSFNKKAPNFKVERNSLWRDLEKQKNADESELQLNQHLAKLNIVLA